MCPLFIVKNASICEKIAKCEQISTLNVNIDAICEKITKYDKIRLSKCIIFLTLNVLKSTQNEQTLF